ncbi:PhzF family phenazine biosynthesis protein [Novosphingobium sp. KCTC 2891]|uniref:PhzF family phenazine biosynthesis protein n=1 Tax=Novosphingobium sp. KCTC 2891 TaxID=2989730 RepID=UPI00222161D3|nr:PhzF family phenazine biosynthesis protein [Novosphingobium sp. KCTC 2891]MCW1382902.1 PhzF family phenazine biosynthesis protein [Novosphingobium sp. KCTC 2891]
MELDLIDVFGAKPLSGNPLAVVRGGEELSGTQMQALTRWLGFSETTFLLPPTDPAADYRVRIFYPAGELPFAGHPTLGTARAWLAAGGVPRRADEIVQECGIGLVPVRPMGDRLAFRAPPLRVSGPLSPEERAEAIRVAGVREDQVVEAIHANNGPAWKLLRLRSAEDVLAAQPVARASVPTDVGLVGPCGPGGEAQFEVRAFFADPVGKVCEDPVTGSLNAGIALALFERGLGGGGYVAAQGRIVGADGQVHVTRDGAEAWIGGSAVIVTRGGTLDL